MYSSYVLIDVEPGMEKSVFSTISKLSLISDANLLLGDHDIIVKIQAEDMREIGTFVINAIRSIEGVSNTKTLACAMF